MNTIAKAIIVAHLAIPALIDVFVEPILGINYILLFLYLCVCFYSFYIYLADGFFSGERTFGGILLLFLTVICISWFISPKYIHYQATSIGVVQDSFLKGTRAQFTSTISVLMTFFPIYIMVKKRIVDTFFLWNLGILLFIITIASYIVDYGQMDLTSYYARKYGVANNAGYALLMLIPLISLRNISHRYYTYAFFFTFLLILLSAKRGAILCMCIIALIFIFFEYIQGTSLRKKSMAIIAVVALSIGAIMVFSMSDNLQRKIEVTKSGKSSGRDVIYETLIYKWENAHITDKVFGFQYNYSYKLFGVDAHNDWLELLTSQGILGVTCYALIFIYLIGYYRRNKNYFELQEKFTFLSILLVWLLKSCMSQVFYAGTTTYFIMALAYVMAETNARKEQMRLEYEL